MKASGQRPPQKCNDRKPSASPERYPDANTRPSALRLCLHAVACLVSLILGFRFSREALLVVATFSQNPGDSIVQRLSSNVNVTADLNISYVPSEAPSAKAPAAETPAAEVPAAEAADSGSDKPHQDPKQTLPPPKSSRVHVGRHEILVRPWPHPDPVEMLAAHALLERVQQEQRRLYSSRDWRHLIVVTPTFSRTFQWPHLTALMHTLRLVPGPLTWIVVEAGRITNQTASLLAQSSLEFIHLNVNKRMPATWIQRRSIESLLRIEALRFVRKQKLDGIIIFADDSNTHSLRFFTEVQSVKWIGALSVGILANFLSRKDSLEFHNSTEHGGQTVPVQGPACNESCHVIGWHLVRPYEQSTGKRLFSTKDLEWAGFVLNSRIIWENAADKPEFILGWNEWISSNKEIPSNPLGIVRDGVFVEPLGNCGREVLLWWLRVEARADSKFPSRWVIDPPLGVIASSKQKPWPHSNSQNLSLLHRTESVSEPEKHRGKHTGRTSRLKQKVSDIPVNGSSAVH